MFSWLEVVVPCRRACCCRCCCVCCWGSLSQVPSMGTTIPCDTLRRWWTRGANADATGSDEHKQIHRTPVCRTTNPNRSIHRFFLCPCQLQLIPWCDPLSIDSIFVFKKGDKSDYAAIPLVANEGWNNGLFLVCCSFLLYFSSHCREIRWVW